MVLGRFVEWSGLGPDSTCLSRPSWQMGHANEGLDTSELTEIHHRLINA